MVLQQGSHEEEIRILVCVYVIAGETRNFENAFELSNVKLSGMPLAFYSGMYAYAGW